MSLLRQAEACLKNQSVHKALNAFISVPGGTEKASDGGSLLRAVRQSQTRRDENRALSPIDGTLIAVKDNISTTDLPTTCASQILKKYSSPYDAIIVRRLREAGAVVAGKTNLDEFGMGSHSVHSHFGPVTNADGMLSAGGSSGGSAVAVATSQCDIALGTDTGGSVRLPAAYTGIVGFKPTYGLVSRHGVVSYANSLDTVGVLSRTVQSAEDVFHPLNHPDPRDPTCLSTTTRSRMTSFVKDHHRSMRAQRPLRIGIPVDYNIAELDPLILSTWLRTLDLLRFKYEQILHPVSLPSTKHALSAYYVLAPSEAASNLAKYDGVRYGTRSPHSNRGGVYASKTRGEGLGDEVKRRILLGSYSLSAERRGNYFVRAQRVRRLVQRDFDSVFALPNPLHAEGRREGSGDGVDVLITPTAPTFAPTLEEVRDAGKRGGVEQYMNDVLTVPASLAGLPALSVPVGVEHAGDERKVAGIQVLGQVGDDRLVLDVGKMIETISTSPSSPP